MKRGIGRTITRVPKYLYIAILALIVVGPLSSLLGKALSDNGVNRLVGSDGFGQILFNTVTLALGSLVLALVLGTGLAIAVHRSPARWRPFLGMIPLMPMIVPGVAEVIGWVFLLSPRAGYLNGLLRQLPWFDDLSRGPVDIFTFEWIVILTGFSFTGFIYLYVRSSLDSIGTELQAAAQVTGASATKIFFTITLPLIRPALVYASGIVLLLGLGQFTGPLLLGSPQGIDVLSTILYQTKQTYPVDYALGAAVSTPLVAAGLLVMFLQRRGIGNVAKYAVVTGKSNARSNRGSAWAAIPVLAFGLVAVVLPIVALVMVSLSPFWTADFSVSDVTFEHFASIAEDSRTIDALQVTVQAIVITTILVVPIGFMGALIQRGAVAVARPARSMTDLLTTLPLSMPAAILGFAMLYAYANPPFSLYGTVAIFVLTYVTLMIPHATRPQLAAMMSVGREFTEAAQVTGASRLKTLLTIELPMFRKGISVAVTMVVILLFHEFAASLMVSSANTQTIGSLLYDYFTGGIYPQVAVLALLMVTVTFAGVALSVLIGGRKALER